MFKLFIFNIDMYIYDGLWFLISIIIYFFIYYIDKYKFWSIVFDNWFKMNFGNIFVVYIVNVCFKCDVVFGV